METKQNQYKTRHNEQFYTKPSCVNYVLSIALDFLKSFKLGFSNKTFIEPSAGTGNFVKWLLKNNFNNIKAFDIEPKCPCVKKANFYKINLKYDKNNIVVGNPPFGYKSKMAIDFVNKSLSFSDIVIFILPIQFRRFGTQSKIKKGAKLVYSSPVLPFNSFIYKNKPTHVNCVFQIWVNDIPKFNKLENLRILIRPANKHKDFKTWIYNNTPETLKYFNKEKYGWDIAIVRQGYYDYSEIITDPRRLRTNRQYLFIKFVSLRAKKIFRLINFNELAESNTSIKGFSNTDLVKKYTELAS